MIIQVYSWEKGMTKKNSCGAGLDLAARSLFRRTNTETQPKLFKKRDNKT